MGKKVSEVSPERRLEILRSGMSTKEQAKELGVKPSSVTALRGALVACGVMGRREREKTLLPARAMVSQARRQVRVILPAAAIRWMGAKVGDEVLVEAGSTEGVVVCVRVEKG